MSFVLYLYTINVYRNFLCNIYTLIRLFSCSYARPPDQARVGVL